MPYPGSEVTAMAFCGKAEVREVEVMDAGLADGFGGSSHVEQQVVVETDRGSFVVVHSGDNPPGGCFFIALPGMEAELKEEICSILNGDEGDPEDAEITATLPANELAEAIAYRLRS